MKIVVISDTHARHVSQLAQNLLRAVAKADLVIHAGDIVTMDVVRGLEALAPLRGVCGNMDLPEVRAALPQTLEIELEGRRIGIEHGSGGPAELEQRVRKSFPGADIVIFGHSHVTLNMWQDGVLLFNPGSARDSYGILELTREGVNGRIVRDYF